MKKVLFEWILREEKYMIWKFDENKKFDYENGFYLTSEPYRLGNIIAHYELYKKIINLPGDIVELGVFRGGSIIQFATFRELLENEKSRKIVGFDVFGEFPNTKEFKSDKEFAENWNKKFSDEVLLKEDLYKSLNYKGIQNIELIQGDIRETIDIYLEQNPHTRIAFLHIDTDVYEPCKIGLEKLFNRIVPEGLAVFDDYATNEGETVAVDEFFKNKDYIIKKFPFSHHKPSYLIKK